MNLDIPHANREGLRRFGLQFSALVIAIFGLLLPWLLDFELPRWPWILGAVVGGWALIAPNTLRPFYRGWMGLGMLLNRVTSPIVLGAVYFLVFAPVALGLRLFGRDLLARAVDPARKSYRMPSNAETVTGDVAEPSEKDFENPF